MGCAGSTGAKNGEVMAKLNEQRGKENGTIRILLLGAGECGKSTVLKQMKIINSTGFTPVESAAAKDLVYKNTLDSIQTLMTAMGDLKIAFDNTESKALAAEIMTVDSSEPISITHLETIKSLWADGAVKICAGRDSEFSMLDSAKYFLDKVEETFVGGYEPSHQDILRARTATTGIVETNFLIDKTNFRMFDVGGQRGERKNWIRCFDNANAIMFIASLSEYNQNTVEDRSRNRLSESLDLFQGICRLHWFEAIRAVILFLNKKDIFEQKVVKYDIGEWHPDYRGGLNYDAGLQYITEKYQARAKVKTLYVHATNATSTDNISFVWSAVKHIIMQNVIDQSGYGY